jgi:serine/threonine protein kinase
MSADSDKKGPDYAEQLAKLESRLQGHSGDQVMLAEVGVAMRSLLAGNGDSENHIRAMLQKQFDAGHLRKETYELVQNLLGKIVTEELVRAPLPASASLGEELFVDTAVIEDQAQAQIDARVPAKAVSESQLQVGSVLRDRYLLKQPVSEGSMGVVYKAMDRRRAEAGEKDANVAIKVLSPQLSRNGAALRALQQEAAKGRCLSHPNIVRFIDLDREGDLYFIVMEWLEGRSLSSILDDSRGGEIDSATALDIVRQTARALDYAHQRGVVHADVKPGNIIITPTGEVKLIDFGVARVRQKENEGKSRFDPAVLRAGTPAYSSMQVLTGEDPVPADDVFSLACLMYRLVAGYRVFGPRNAAQAAEDGMEPQKPQGLTDKQWQPLKKALSYSRVTRFASPSEFIKALGIKDVKSGPKAMIDFDEQQSDANGRVEKIPAPPPIQAEKVKPPEIEAEREYPATVRLENPMAVPIRADKEPIMYHADDDDDVDDDDERRSPWRLIVIGIIIIASAAVVVTQTELVDQIAETVEKIDISPVTSAFDKAPEIVDAPPVDEEAQDVAEFSPESKSNQSAVAQDVAEEAAPTEVEDPMVAEDNEAVVPSEFLEDLAPQEPLFDYSTLPPATLTITLGAAADGTSGADLTMREGGDPAVVDVFRSEFSEPMSARISEAEFSGNQSPWKSGQYSIENDGQLEFAAGQERARISISMRSNPVREPDREVVLRVRDAASPTTDLARINLVLEDDDQRTFERGLPVNTVGFAVNQISVREFDPAAQIDVIRYNPDNTTLEVGYVLLDVTATEGQDYFMPGSTIIYFAAGQRSARILVPLGQDARQEPDEAFMLELETESVPSDSNIFSQIAVMIRDDDS